jgi:chromosome segregation protein
MFKLQRLEITGFKSFADHTEIVFTGSGITGVVGPNGCGKSNVSDAISWVLGEQRARSLRGAEMKDVVFQGSRNRQPAGMAEVVLHLVRDENFIPSDESDLEDIDRALSEIDENSVDMDAIEGVEEEADDTLAAEIVELAESDETEVEKVQAAQVGSIQTVEKTIKTKRHWRPRAFALDFAPGEAVSVTRRLYLSGESEYQLNGKTCRLRDIQDLFAGTGLSGAHYAIIEQGRIGQILSAKPSDRRSLIEEAAGISKFRTRQRAAEARLDGARSNLSRITDIVVEVEKQANSLRRQASKTRRYMVLQDEFKVLLRKTFAAEGAFYNSHIDALKQQLEAAVAAEREMAEKVKASEENSRETTRAARLAEEALAVIRGKHSENALRRDRSERELRYQSEQIQNLTTRTETLSGDIKAAEVRSRMTVEEIERLKQSEAKEIAQAEKAEQELREAEKIYTEKVFAAKKIEDELETRRGELLKHTAAVERFGEIDRQLKLNLDRLSERLEGLKREKIRADQTLKDHIADLERTREELASEQEKLRAFQTERAEVAAAAEGARGELQQAENELRSLQSEQQRVRNRLETLNELNEKRAVFAPQVQKLFAAKDAIGVSPVGVLADYLAVDEAAEQAVESVFGDSLQTVLVGTLDEAKKVGDWLAANNVGRIAVLIVGGIGLNASSAADARSGARLGDLLGCSAELAAVLREVFPREMSAVLTDDLAAGNAELKVNFAGDILAAERLFTAGVRVTDGKNDSLLAFKRELSGLARSAEKFTGSVAKAEAAVTKKRDALRNFEEKTVDLQSVILTIERKLDTLELKTQNERQEIERAERHIKIVDEESKQVAGEIETIGEDITKTKNDLDALEALRNDAREHVERITQAYSQARSDTQIEVDSLNEKRTFAATSLERRRSAQATLKRVETEKAELERRITTLTEDIRATERGIEETKAAKRETETAIANSASEIDQESVELTAAIAAVEAARTAADEASTELSGLNHKAAELMNERGGVEVRRTEAVTQLRSITEKCRAELNMPLEELVASEPPEDEFDLESARNDVETLRDRLESFGAINMLAVDELAESEERLVFLTSQRKDIIDSIESAQEALHEIKERSRARFKEAFEAVNANFVEFFQELFGGGRGEMTLLESDDILEAGIEVVAQPPGKRLQNILLLSGGEKAMTAIALVLAIFKYRPSPFCLLDEVDAPLDEANVGRFVNKISEMAENIQFLVITHNKRTMEAARALYGVTMQEAGVSKVVSVKFE